MGEDFTPNDNSRVSLEFGIYMVALIVMIGIGFVLMGNQGVFQKENFLGYWFLYLVFNVGYLSFAGIFLFYPNLKGKILLYFHNYEYSLINVFADLPKKNIVRRISENFVLTFLAWHIILFPLVLLQFLLPRQTILPVAPNVVFPIVGLITSIFFSIFPASTGETGILTIFNSLFVTPIFKFIKDKRVSAIIGLILISVASGYVWVFVHGFIDQGQQVNQIAHFAFGVESGFLTVLTGSIAPAIALHDINLFYYGILDFMGKYEFAKIAIPFTISLVWISFMGLLYYLNKKR